MRQAIKTEARWCMWEGETETSSVSVFLQHNLRRLRPTIKTEALRCMGEWETETSSVAMVVSFSQGCISMLKWTLNAVYLLHEATKNVEAPPDARNHTASNAEGINIYTWRPSKCRRRISWALNTKKHILLTRERNSHYTQTHNGAHWRSSN